MSRQRTSSFTKAFLEECPSQTVSRVETLIQIQSQHDELIQQHRDHLADLERKFITSCTRLYEQQSRVICQDEKDVKQIANRANKRAHRNSTEAEEQRGIPEFWLRALKNNPLIERTISEAEEEALKFVRDIRLKCLDEGQRGFRLEFEFYANNPFFKNRTLTKTFIYERDGEHYAGELVYGEAPGDTIVWEKGWSLVSVVVQGRDGKELREQSAYFSWSYKSVPDDPVKAPSFFDLFDTPVNPDTASARDEDDDSSGSEDDGDSDEDSDFSGDSKTGEEDDASDGLDGTDPEQAYEDMLVEHFEIGEELKDSVIPYAVHWFTGEARLYEDTDEETDED